LYLIILFFVYYIVTNDAFTLVSIVHCTVFMLPRLIWLLIFSQSLVLGSRTVVYQMLPKWGLPDVSVVKGGCYDVSINKPRGE
jgi:hypothetical protein